MITVIVNGEARTVSATSTLADLVVQLDLPADGIAAAIDRVVIPRSEHATTRLLPDVHIEIIRAVGGG